MATSTQSPNDLTRQQLDELDDLLQRMLSLPLNPPESFAPAVPPAQAYVPPMPTPAPVPPARETPIASAAPAPRAFAPSPAAPPESVESPFNFRPAPAPQPAPRPEPARAPAIERPAPAVPYPAALPAPSSPAITRGEPVPFLYAPLVGFNAVLNWTLGLFGFPGRVLRSGFVKTLFGLAGIGLLAYTGLKVAQIHGLVALPQELPWPPR